MAQVHLHIGSFNSGELTPLMGDRFAVEKVQSGCRRLRNFLLHVHGPAFRRPGLIRQGAAMSQTYKSRLIPFNFSTTTGFILELCPDGLKVWSNGAAVPLDAPVSLPYSEAECFEVQFHQINDVVKLVHPDHETQQLVRYTDTDWQLIDTDWTWPPMGDENTTTTTLSVSLDFYADPLGNLYESPTGENYAS